MPATITKCDAIEWLDSLEGESVDLVVMDPPYGHGRIKWDQGSPVLTSRFWRALWSVTKPDAAIIVFAQGMFTARVMTLQHRNWRYNLVWEKNKTTGFLNANKMPLRSHEDICVFYRKAPVYNPQMTEGHAPQNMANRTSMGQSYGSAKLETSRHGKTTRHPNSVLQFDVVNNDSKEKFHPTQKPVELIQWLIRSYSNRWDTIIDPFAGSGTTIIAAIAEDRTGLGCDSDGKMVRRARRRIQKAWAAS